MRVLIAPVGEQPTPNLIPLFALPPEQSPNCVQFLESDNNRIKAVSNNLGNAITKDPVLDGTEVANPCPMNAWDLQKARDDCAAVIARYTDEGHQVTVNLTGGTKIMALAAYQAACNAKVPMIYVNTEQRQIIHFDLNGVQVSEDPFTAPISIETQLRAAGREFKQYSKKPFKRLRDCKVYSCPLSDCSHKSDTKDSGKSAESRATSTI
jgi:hypothetical protein